MTMLDALTRSALTRCAVHAALVTVIAASCRPGAPAETAGAATETVEPTATAPTAAPTGPVKCEGELVPAEDGLVEDFEDGNGQVSVVAGRDGYWWTANDDKGTEITAPSGNFAPADGGADGGKAAHVTGTTAAGTDAWGAEFGTNWVSGSGALYDASKYAGIRFKAKASGPTNEIRVSLSDVNTHQDAGVCKQCWNHFQKNFALTEVWADYSIDFADLKQRQGWGDPRPATVDSSKLIGIGFALAGGNAFDVWVDNIQFLVCKQ